MTPAEYEGWAVKFMSYVEEKRPDHLAALRVVLAEQRSHGQLKGGVVAVASRWAQGVLNGTVEGRQKFCLITDWLHQKLNIRLEVPAISLLYITADRDGRLDDREIVYSRFSPGVPRPTGYRREEALDLR
jgi:hypothetical protein